MDRHILVIGSGIVGSSIALHLAERGARVTVVDAAEGGGIATRASWAWINASWGNAEPYFRFRHRSMQMWRELAGRVRAVGLTCCGAICWDLPPEALRAFAAEHGGWGYGIRAVNADEIRGLEPSLRRVPEHALHVAEEGVVEPHVASAALLQAACEQNATFRPRTHVKRLLMADGKVRGAETESGSIAADEVVVAAGAGSVQLLQSAGFALPLSTPPGLLVHSEPVAKFINGLLIAPELHVRQTAEGRVVAGSDFSGSEPGERPDETAKALFRKVQDFFTDGDRLRLGFHTVGYRPTPKDGLPVIGRAPGVEGLYMAVMHSGITNAAATGQMAAREILDGDRDPLLAPFVPDRFAQA
jgi:glycine/D-amino acid oxidase-like deaminating enzyme